jgi:holo-ACP synthase
MMDARERRFFTRRGLLPAGTEGLVLLQICINTPGEEKNSSAIREMYAAALDSLKKAAPESLRGLESYEDRPTGPEGFLLFAMEGRELKRLCFSLEETHPLGRLWDLDVFLPDGTQISRRDLDLPPRSCFLGGENAHDCARSRKHSVAELTEYIHTLFQACKA